jgi:microcystin-dependent protein
MPYNIRFTDPDKSEITVFDSTSNNETSLIFPGRNVVGYGKIIAENFLRLLENFASNSPPDSSIEGQLWYDSANESLQVSDGVTWKAASGILKGSVEPSLESSKEGELWVDTVNQQLKIFNGSRWILVGPSQSFIQGLKYGPVVETMIDTDNISRNIILFYVADVPVIIVSKDSFTPKLAIPGYITIRSGINVNSPSTDFQQFAGGFTPKINGIATSAESLKLSNSDIPIPASRFLRSDETNITDFGFNIRNDNGMIIGSNQNFRLTSSLSSVNVYNSSQNGNINLQINRGGTADTILAITGPTTGGKVGINNPDPTEALDVIGNILSSGILTLSNISESTNLENGSVRIAGGVSIKKSLRVGGSFIIGNTTESRDIIPSFPRTEGPRLGESWDLGSESFRWENVYAKKIKADTIEGVFSPGTVIDGTTKIATSLAGSGFGLQLIGDINSSSVNFIDSGTTRIISTTLSSNIIIDKPEPAGGFSRKGDFILVHRPDQPGVVNPGLQKQTRDSFIADLGIPIGAIFPYAGQNPPRGFLFCDGSEVLITAYPDLYNIIRDIYNGITPLFAPFSNGQPISFRLPDLRGRFPLGRNNMDNSLQVPLPTGGFIDAGGGTALDIDDPTQERVSGTNLLSSAGGNSSRSIQLQNLPDHSHSLNAGGQQYSAIRLGTNLVPPGNTGLGPTATGQAQYLSDSGGIKKPSDSFLLGQQFNVMNPYLTVNYIIRSGPSEQSFTF